MAEALFAERGFDGASIREIAEQAGATKALIYHYYANKEALYQTLLEDAVSGVVTQIETIAADGSEPETQIRAVVQVFIDAYHDAPHRFQMVQRTIDDHHAIAACWPTAGSRGRTAPCRTLWRAAYGRAV